MNLRLIREPSLRGTTLGVLLKDGFLFGHTLEDEVREIAGQSVEQWKVAGKTAIPSGRYRIQVTPSPRFRKRLPILLGVPGFSGIRIHALNSSDESEGCIGIGLSRDDVSRRIFNSAKAVEGLTSLMEIEQDRQVPIWIEIENART